MYTVHLTTGQRLYTLKKVAGGEVTKSAHPARFSPDDKFSRYVLPHPNPPSPFSFRLSHRPIESLMREVGLMGVHGDDLR